MGCGRLDKNARNSPKPDPRTELPERHPQSGTANEKARQACQRYRFVNVVREGRRKDGNSIETAKLFQERLVRRLMEETLVGSSIHESQRVCEPRRAVLDV